jgi:uncharacterized membrane protein
VETITIDITAPPERVWAVMLDVEKWPTWTPSVRSIKRLDSGPLTVGSRVLIHQPKFPPARWTVTEMMAGSRFTWRSGLPGMWVYAKHTIVPTATGSRVTLAVHYCGLLGKLLARMTRGVTRRYLEFEANGLKKQSETSTKPASQKVFPASPSPQHLS